MLLENVVNFPVIWKKGQKHFSKAMVVSFVQYTSTFFFQSTGKLIEYVLTYKSIQAFNKSYFLFCLEIEMFASIYVIELYIYIYVIFVQTIDVCLVPHNRKRANG